MTDAEPKWSRRRDASVLPIETRWPVDIGTRLNSRLSLADDGNDMVDPADQPVNCPVETDTLSSAQSANASTRMAAFDP
jgi:hypothetical protein